MSSFKNYKNFKGRLSQDYQIYEGYERCPPEYNFDGSLSDEDLLEDKDTWNILSETEEDLCKEDDESHYYLEGDRKSSS